jgi:hypothetical protein
MAAIETRPGSQREAATVSAHSRNLGRPPAGDQQQPTDNADPLNSNITRRREAALILTLPDGEANEFHCNLPSLPSSKGDIPCSIHFWAY